MVTMVTMVDAIDTYALSALLPQSVIIVNNQHSENNKRYIIPVIQKYFSTWRIRYYNAHPAFF